MLEIGCLVIVFLALLLWGFAQRAAKSEQDTRSITENASVVPLAEAGCDPRQFGSLRWKRLVFLDLETTGLGPRDRIVTIAAIFFHTEAVHGSQLEVRVLHRIYNPGIKCSAAASAIHGHTDWTLRHQPFFTEEAHELVDFLGQGEVIVCHNAKFDVPFFNRELENVGLAPLSMESFCTMEHYRKRFEGSARLDVVAGKLGLRREGRHHSALEDAWLAMNVFLQLQGTSLHIPFASVADRQPALQNFRAVPPLPVGPLPPRKRRPRQAAIERA